MLPLFFTANAMRVLLTESYVRAAYPRLGDEEILTEERRTELALIGLRAVDPLRANSVDVLRRQRLPDGTRAFAADEIRHMDDVRVWLWRLLAFELAVAAALVVLAGRSRPELARALRVGGLSTLVLAAGALVAMLLAFDIVLLGFHKLLFEGETWHFANEDTLIRVYPESFWNATGIVIAILVVAQAGAALAAGEAIARRSRTART